MQVPALYIQEYDSVPPLWLAMVGFPGHGQSTFFASMIQILQRIGEVWDGAVLRYHDLFTTGFMDKIVQELFAEGRFPSPTAPSEIPRPVIMSLYNVPKAGSHCIVAYELGTEAFSSLEELYLSNEERLTPIRQVNTIWFLISLTDLINDMTRTLVDLFNVYMAGMGRLNAQLSGRNLVVIYTKTDLFLKNIISERYRERLADYMAKDPFKDLFENKSNPQNSFSMPSYLAEMSEISNLLENMTRKLSGGAAFINMARSTGLNLRFTAVSAINPVEEFGASSNLLPHRVLDPLIWAIDFQPKIPEGEIFISYSRSDWDIYVKPLVEALKTEGYTVWVDQHLLEGGQDWLDEINTALTRCKVMLLCVSPEALASKWVKIEYRFFVTHDKPILPVICRSAPLPAELGGIQYLPHSEFALIEGRLKSLLTHPNQSQP